jgi:hypothetical protein
MDEPRKLDYATPPPNPQSDRDTRAIGFYEFISYSMISLVNLWVMVMLFVLRPFQPSVGFAVFLLWVLFCAWRAIAGLMANLSR